jgi:hypothetical protein
MTREKILEGVKTALGMVAGIGITVLCGAFAGNVATASNAGTWKKVGMAIGGLVIGGMVSNQAEKFINAEVDTTVQQYDTVVEAIKKAKSGQPAEASE